MSTKTRRKIDPATRAGIALAAIREDASTARLARQYEIHPSQIHAWKKQLLEHAVRALDPGVGAETEADREGDEIGQLSLERDFSTKRSAR